MDLKSYFPSRTCSYSLYSYTRLKPIPLSRMPRGAAEDDQEFDPTKPENADTDEILGKSLFLVSSLIYDNGLVINISCLSRGRRRSDGSIQYCGR